MAKRKLPPITTKKGASKAEGAKEHDHKPGHKCPACGKKY
jgi:ssDNA-binding Zn-finger/Zn-ribbon topoisomerase 1